SIALSIYRHIRNNGKRMIMGSFYSVKVEFWSKPEDLSPHMFKRAMEQSGIMDKLALKGSIVAPVTNGFAKVFAPEEQIFVDYRVGTVKTKTLKIFTKETLNRVNFPIDIVYTWVDGSDKDWQKRYVKAKKELDPNYNNNS